jgi:ATP-dependent Clp endopeptidase proteolytic subunit ClpP
MHSNFGSKKFSFNRCEPTPDITPDLSFLEPTYLEVVDNRVYFYSEITRDSVLKLNKTLHGISNQVITQAIIVEGVQDKVFLHINSNGGELYAGLACVDHIINLKKKVDVVSIVDGVAASAGSLISCVCSRRLMHKHSRILIHQLSGGVWGKYEELKDGMSNVHDEMKLIKEIYLEHTKIPKAKLNELLKHDIMFDSKTCLEYGLVDEII